MTGKLGKKARGGGGARLCARYSGLSRLEFNVKTDRSSSGRFSSNSVSLKVYPAHHMRRKGFQSSARGRKWILRLESTRGRLRARSDGYVPLALIISPGR